MTICLFEKAKHFAEFGDDASVTTVKITRRGRFLIAGHFQSWNATVVNWAKKQYTQPTMISDLSRIDYLWQPLLFFWKSK